MPALTMDQLRGIITHFEALYPDYYGYTDIHDMRVDGVPWRYYLFRNRDESFNKENAVITVRYLDSL